MSYLVAQVGDIVRIDRPGQLVGTFGEVVRSRSDPLPSVTGRVCIVRSDMGPEVEVHADALTVVVGSLPPPDMNAFCGGGSPS